MIICGGCGGLRAIFRSGFTYVTKCYPKNGLNPPHPPHPRSLDTATRTSAGAISGSECCVSTTPGPLALISAAQVVASGYTCGLHRQPVAAAAATWLDDRTLLATTAPTCGCVPTTWILDATQYHGCVVIARSTGQQCRRLARPGTGRCPAHQAPPRATPW
jgi:hypothetical protein